MDNSQMRRDRLGAAALAGVVLLAILVAACGPDAPLDCADPTNEETGYCVQQAESGRLQDLATSALNRADAAHQVIGTLEDENVPLTERQNDLVTRVSVLESDDATLVSEIDRLDRGIARLAESIDSVAALATCPSRTEREFILNAATEVGAALAIATQAEGIIDLIEFNVDVLRIGSLGVYRSHALVLSFAANALRERADSLRGPSNAVRSSFRSVLSATIRGTSDTFNFVDGLASNETDAWDLARDARREFASVRSTARILSRDVARLCRD